MLSAKPSAPRPSSYRTHTFFTVYAVSREDPADDSDSTLAVHRISGFVLPEGLITVRLSPWYDIDTVSQRFDELAVRSTASARWCTACSTSSSTSISSEAGARRRYRVARGRSVREQHASGWVASARLSGCARTWSSCAGWCYLCARSSTQFSIAARREDRAGARPAVRRPVRPCAAGVRVDGVAAGHGHDGVRDEPVTARTPG